MINNLTEIKEILKTPQKVFITTHFRPDADALGSCLALYHFLNAKGHQANFVIPSECPYFYDWFPGVKDSVDFQKNRSRAISILNNATLIIAVDFNKLSRNGELSKLLSASQTTKILVDHHPEPEKVFNYYMWNDKLAAAAEMVYEMIYNMDKEMLFDQRIATSLYAAIVSDSGGFVFPSTRPETLRIAAHLMESGIDHSLIQRLLYDNFTEDRLRFWGLCVQEKMEIIPELNTAYIAIPKKDLLDRKLKTSDLEGMANFPLILKNIRLSALLVERDDYVKISLRSKLTFPVNQLAMKYFNGGGHLNAAGGDICLPFEEAIQLFKDKLLEFKDYLI